LHRYGRIEGSVANGQIRRSVGLKDNPRAASAAIPRQIEHGLAHIDAVDLSAGTDGFSHFGGQESGPGANIQDALAGLELQCIEDCLPSSGCVPR
jgi:hypothetical protein